MVNMDKIGFGIDVGGSGIKGAKVDLATGEFVGDRIRFDTPQPATPDAVAATIVEILKLAEWDGPVGITLPAVVQHQIVKTAANIDQAWIGTDAHELFQKYLPGRDVVFLNDADAAGIAEITFGEPRASVGVVLLLTLGTGIGSALFVNGTLVPNTELGHMEVNGDEAEHFAASSAREREDLSYKKWAKRVSLAFTAYENLFWPDLIIVGGGISRNFEKWGPRLTNETEVVPAILRNRAGIVGAAMAIQKGIKP